MEVGDVTIARFGPFGKRLNDELNIEIIANELFTLINVDGRKKVVLNFSIVEYLNSTTLGVLHAMQKKANAVGAKLQLCCLRSEISEVFSMTCLDKYFDIKPTLEEAIIGL